MTQEQNKRAPTQLQSERVINIIVREHQGLWRVIDLMDMLEQDMNINAKQPDELLLTTIFDYIEHFSDRVHSQPTEIFLYKLLREKSPETGPLLDKLERGYVIGHEKLQELRQLLKNCMVQWPDGREAFGHGLGRFSAALRKHIKKEEGVVIPRAREILNEDDWGAIVVARDQQDDPLFGERVREEFRELRHKIISLTPERLGGLGLAHSPRVTAHREGQEMLSIKGLVSSYGQIEVLHDVDITINAGEIVSLVGANGAGKSTLLMTISGLQSADKGQLLFDGEDLSTISADKRVTKGIVQVPEGRQVFKDMTVYDNLLLGAYTRSGDAEIQSDIERIYSKFPILRQKRYNLAGELSGGQQQMLAMGRALMSRPRLLLLDEPSMGLAPLIIEEIFEIIRELKDEGMTIFLVEQNASQALALADRGYVLETGNVVLTGTGKELLSNEKVREAYLGM
ncbi:MAG: ATP-binding cassette domain-containing protein [Gammaproteobacteria bacterium]|jgi:branched-chain amino acid transport system ATP-binding protein|nr:ATP-binding cassette domain-containing protein [Gammaproteobacteria bacterium]